MKPTTTFLRAAAALSILGARALRRKRDYGGAAEENTYGLPQGEPIARELRKWLLSQRAAVLSAIPETGPLPEEFPALSGPDWDLPMATAMTPILGNYWDREGKETYARLGLDPDDWQVKSPKLAGQIQKQSFTFCASTNATTDLRLHQALEALREAFTAGMVTEGETLPQLAKRVGSIFKGLSSQHAELIAATEASRAVHAAQLAADHDSGVVSGLELLLSSDACPLCRKIATECRRVRLGHAFAVVGEHPEYSQIRHPPLHPYCQCTVIEVLSPEYGGPSDPEWGATLLQPQKQIGKDGGQYTPPPGKVTPKPEPGKPKPVVSQPVEHPAVADRLPKPPRAEDAEKYVIFEPPAPEKPKPPKKPAKPRFPKDPDALEVVRPLGGSTGAELVRDPKTGREYVRKRGRHADHLREEDIADRAYRAMGVAVPDSKLYETAGGPVKLSEFHKGVTLGELDRSDPDRAGVVRAKLREHFVADALLGNWDVIGTGDDNILVSDAGEIYRIDNGGSLRFRAQGQKKPDSQFGPIVGELVSMKDPAINAYAAKTFGPVSDDEIKAQAKALVRRRAKILAALPEELRATIGARLDHLKSIAQAKPPKKPKKIKGWAPAPEANFKKFGDWQTAHSTYGDTQEMDRWGRDKYAEWAGKLTAEQSRALGSYTGGGYRQTNLDLRSGAKESDNPKMAKLAASLRQASLPEGIQVRRDFDERAALSYDLYGAGYGSLFTEKAFMSTTLKPEGAGFGSAGVPHLVLRLPAGAPGAYVNASSDSSVPHEKEFLLPPGATFRVVEVHGPAGRPHKVVAELVKK